MTILDDTYYPAIRAALDVGITRTDLPDEVIEEDIFLGRAESELLARMPDAASKTGDELAAVKRALVYLTAALLAHSVVRITSVSINARDLRYARQTFDPDEKAAELRARAEREIGSILSPGEESPARPTMFTTAAGYRGR